jgi:hypothetical protein
MLQAGRSRVRFPMSSFNLSRRTMVLGSTRPLTEINTRIPPGGKGRPERKVDKLTITCEPTAQKMCEPRRLTTRWTSTACYRDSFLWLYSPLLGLGRFFSFLILYTIGRFPWTGDQPVSRPVPTQRTTQTQNKRRQTSMPRVKFQPMIPAFEPAKTFHALDRAALWSASWLISTKTSIMVVN